MAVLVVKALPIIRKLEAGLGRRTRLSASKNVTCASPFQVLPARFYVAHLESNAEP